MQEKKNNKREFIKKATYMVPAVLTLVAVPSSASSGSGPTPVRDIQKLKPVKKLKR